MGRFTERGGTEIYDQCKRIRETEYPDGKLPTGQAVKQPRQFAAGYIITQVGPIYGQNDGLDGPIACRFLPPLPKLS